jgi:hypothetical protein
MAQSKEEKAAYHKAYCEANKEKITATKKAYYEANKEKITANKKAYYKANKERREAYDKAYYEANKEKKVANNKAYYEANKERREANKEKIAATKKAYREANKEKTSAYSKAYYEDNMCKYSAYASKRRALKRKLIPKHLKNCPVEKQRVLDIFKLRSLISMATGVKHHVDHMWPLYDGGPHWSGNLQIITAHENMSKHTSVDLELKHNIQQSLKETM